MNRLSLLTDLYQLTMLCGYHGNDKLRQQSCFDLYFRRLPFKGGFCVAAGLEIALGYVQNLRFEAPELQYLGSLGLFPEDFLSWLGEFRFQGEIWALPEGELVFEGEPLLRLRSTLPEAQLVESALLNIMNFQTLVATKAARICHAAGDGQVLEFGLRRAQGVDGAVSASRAAYIGGCHATSNTLAGERYGIPVKGTHAHSWVMSFDSELEAFRAYARVYPDSTVLLVDTYDTLESGLPNAVVVGQELAQQGHTLHGIRLDSGDMAKLSIAARDMLDAGGLVDTRIVASNDLDEHSITELRSRGARIDIWGVGTNLVTCKDEPALGGVYKLVAASNPEGVMQPRIKVSAEPSKTTVPGVKQLYRAYDAGGTMVGDVLALESESFPSQGEINSTHPLTGETRQMSYHVLRPLLQQVMVDGAGTMEPETLATKRSRTLEALGTLGSEFKGLEVPQPYFVGLSDALLELRDSMLHDVEFNPAR